MKSDAGSGRKSGLNFGGVPITHRIQIGREWYYYTDAQWARRLERLIMLDNVAKKDYNKHIG